MNDIDFMKLALKEANKSLKYNDIPVGSIIVKDGVIISKSYNKRVKNNKISSHAEIDAIEKAEKKLNRLNLSDCTIYSTLEPCPMCAYAIMESRIKRLVFGAIDNKKGSITKLNMFNKNIGPKIEICGNILIDECSSIIKDFFNEIR